MKQSPTKLLSNKNNWCIYVCLLKKLSSFSYAKITIEIKYYLCAIETLEERRASRPLKLQIYLRKQEEQILK